MLFLSVTAEEQGLWGSAWYAQKSHLPCRKNTCQYQYGWFKSF
nr:hypothetical protein [Paraflavitalea speifideiaquila]